MNIPVMKHNYLKYSIPVIIALNLLFVRFGYAQSVYQPYSYQFDQKLSSDLYSTSTRQHTSLKPFFADDSLVKKQYDSLINYGADGKQYSLLYRKLFTEHQIDYKGDR